MLTLTRTFEFCSSHTLRRSEWSDEENRRVFGKCSNPNGHGHNYRLEVTVSGPVNPQSAMIVDAKAIDAVVEEMVFRDIDHKDLNRDVPWLTGQLPTSETLVNAIWSRLETSMSTLAPNVALHQLTLYETRRIYVTRTKL